jgi:uncharacterized protein
VARLSADGAELLSKSWDALARERIDDARRALAANDLDALAAMLPAREHWRLYPSFSEQAVFFDLECDGDGVPTVAGTFDADGPRTFLRGRDFDDVLEVLARRRLWVTFNGRCYDVPGLQRHFGSRCPTPAAHVDLRFLCRRVKWPGGLKQIEDAIGLSRPLHLRGVNGLAAIRLWRVWEEERSLDALRLLVEYNLYDAIDLRGVLDRAYNEAIDRLALSAPRLMPFDRADVLYDLSKLLLSLTP